MGGPCYFVNQMIHSNHVINERSKKMLRNVLVGVAVGVVTVLLGGATLLAVGLGLVAAVVSSQV